MSDETNAMERTIGVVLRTGVLASAGLLMLSLVEMAIRRRGSHEKVTLGSLHGLTHLRPSALASLGIMLLLATPAVQLVTSSLLFWRRKERAFAGVAVLVLTIIVVGTFVSKGAAA